MDTSYDSASVTFFGLKASITCPQSGALSCGKRCERDVEIRFESAPGFSCLDPNPTHPFFSAVKRAIALLGEFVVPCILRVSTLLTSFVRMLSTAEAHLFFQPFYLFLAHLLRLLLLLHGVDIHGIGVSCCWWSLRQGRS